MTAGAQSDSTATGAMPPLRDAGAAQPGDALPPGYAADAAALYDDEEVAASEADDVRIESLARLAQGGPALELGVGSGRVAIPLAQHGVRMHGIDISAPMLERLRHKPGGDLIRTVEGDFAEFCIDERFSLVFLVFDTLAALRTQERQVRCFEHVAAHLRDGGLFVLEASVPSRSPSTEAATGHSLLVKSMRPDRVQLEANWHDAVNQVIYTQWMFLRDGSVRLFPFEMRYAWPSEMDLMARIAGMRLRDRWGGWRGEEFTSSSQIHVSVYERTAAQP